MTRRISKKLSRFVKHTVLLYGEGQTERAFLKHSKVLYASGNPKLSVKIDAYHGGNPEIIINEAIKVMNIGFDEAAVLLDTDKIWKKSTCKLAQAKHLKMVGSEPCIEGLLLSVLEGKNYSTRTTKFCKDRFHKLYLNERDATDYRKYSRLFTKKILDKSKAKLKQIEILIDLLTKL